MKRQLVRGAYRYMLQKQSGAVVDVKQFPLWNTRHGSPSRGTGEYDCVRLSSGRLTSVSTSRKVSSLAATKTTEIPAFVQRVEHSVEYEEDARDAYLTLSVGATHQSSREEAWLMVLQACRIMHTFLAQGKDRSKRCCTCSVIMLGAEHALQMCS